MAEQMELPEADSTNQKNEEAEEVEGRYFMELDRAMVDEERRRVEEEFEPLPSYLLDEEEKSAVKSLPVSTLFISNLRTDITETGLTNTFCKFGNILGVEIWSNKNAFGKFKNTNCAKVSYATKQEAADAIQNVHNKPPLHLNVAMERKQEARDAFNKRVEFGNEWMERHANFEKAKEKIVQDVIGRVKVDEVESGKKSISVDQANEKAENLSGIEEENYQNVTAQNLNRVKEENEHYHLSEGGHKITTKETAPLEASDNLKEILSPLTETVGSVTDGSMGGTCKGKVYIPSDQSSATASSSSSSAVFGYELILPSLSPLPCLHCRQLGRMVCCRCHGWYCSIDCQVHHWPVHKDSCHPIQEQGGIILMGGAGRSKDKEQGEASRSSGSKSAKRYSSNASAERNRREPKEKFSVREKTNASSFDQSKSNEEKKKEDEEEEETRSFDYRTGVVYQTGQYGSLPQVENVGTAQDVSVEPVIQPTQMSGWTEIVLPISEMESPYRFWVVPKFNEEMLAQLGRDLEQHVATASDIVEAVEGGFRLVEVSGGWHRAQILRVDDDSQMALVRLVDLGRDMSVKCNCLLRLPLHLAATPAMAVMMRLAGVRPLRGQYWTEADLDNFNYFLSNDTDNSRMWVKPVGFLEGTMLVSMEDDEGNNIADVMVAFKKARKGIERADIVQIPPQSNKNRSTSGEVEEIGHFRSEFGLKSNSEEISTSRRNKSVSSCEEAEKIDPFKPELKKNTIFIGRNFPSDVAKTVNNNTPLTGEAEDQKSRQKSNWEMTGHTEDTPMSSREEDDSISAQSKSPKLIIERMEVGNVYEFGRAEGHPLSEFGAMSHFDSTTFDYIYNDMQLEYSVGGEDFGPANKGDELVVYSTDKSTFYRAVVLDFPTDEHVEVLLTDVGDTEVVRSTDLRVMGGRAANLHKFPFLAVRFNSLSPQAEESIAKDEGRNIRVRVESLGEGEEGGAVVGVLNEANAVVAKYKVDAWQYLHPLIYQLKPTEMKDTIPQRVSRHQAVFISQIEPVKIADGATVNLHNIGKFACFGIIQLTDTEHVFQSLKQALKVCETLPRIDFPPEIGQILAVSQKASGRNMNRAEVVKVDRSGRKATVKCLDTPDTMALPWANMTLLPDIAVAIPAQCRQMRLAGVPKIPRKTALQLLRPIAARLEQPLVLKYHHEDQEMPSIYLRESSGARINDIIITTLQQHDEAEIKESPNLGTFIPRVVREKYRKSAQVKQMEEASSSKTKIKELVGSSPVLEYDRENLHSLPVGHDEEVFVLNVTEDKSELHVCRMDLLDQIKNLQENLQEIGSLIKDSASSVVVNHVYLAQSVDDMWYRVVVLKTKRQKCLAYFPDFGFKEKILFEKIRVFHDEYYRYVKSVPFFASLCVVDKIEDENANVRGDISEKSTQRIRIKSRDEGIYFIDVLSLN